MYIHATALYTPLLELNVTLMFCSIFDVDIPDDLQMDVSNIVEQRKRRKLTAMEDDDRIISSSEVQIDYHIANIHQWLNGYSKDDDNQILPIVDLRSYEDFDKQHIDIANSSINREVIPTIVNLPLSTLLSERSCELPPRHVEFAILIPRQYTQQFLERSDDCDIHQLFFASMSESTLQSRKPWLVRQILIDSDTLWKDASALGLVKSYSDRESTTSFQRLPRLWKPDPITTNILPILKEWTRNEDQNRIGLVLDLGSGAGRDVCYLAEELKEYQSTQKSTKNSIHVVGIDNHKGSAKRCIPLWKNRKVEDITNSVLLDLNKLHQVRSALMDTSKLLSHHMQQQSEIICLYAIRFLNRKLLSYIANSTINSTETDSIQSKPTSKKAIHSPPQPLILPIGTIFAMSHFCKPKDGAAWNFDHPKESSVLEKSELKNLFETKGWQVLRDDIIFDGDHGRTLVQFIAKKVA